MRSEFRIRSLHRTALSSVAACRLAPNSNERKNHLCVGIWGEYRIEKHRIVVQERGEQIPLFLSARIYATVCQCMRWMEGEREREKERN